MTKYVHFLNYYRQTIMQNRTHQINTQFKNQSWAGFTRRLNTLKLVSGHYIQHKIYSESNLHVG